MTMFHPGEATPRGVSSSEPWENEEISLSAPVTLWFVNTDTPERVLRSEPHVDRGFGRKFLSQLNPAWPVTLIGTFPLNRSTQADRGEFYIAAYGDVTVVHTLLDGTERLSGIDERLLTAIPAEDVYAFSRPAGIPGPAATFGGFAHWHRGDLNRSLCCTRTIIIEDVGLPEPFEAPYWAGDTTPPLGGLALPFVPSELVAEAERHWLGVPISPDGPDLPVAAFAVDGRPAPKFDNADRRHRSSVQDIADRSVHRLGLGPVEADYDDYEQAGASERDDEFAQFTASVTGAARRFARGTLRNLQQLRETVTERIRHIDRS